MIPDLEARGHHVVAPDLSGAGRCLAEQATMEGYRDAILEILKPNDVLVGHSMGGYVMTVVADAGPCRLAHLIYLAAGVPVEGKAIVAATPLDVGEIAAASIPCKTPYGPVFVSITPH
jgi:pimeloyl-ACP methyl ester carboxylesterase